MMRVHRTHPVVAVLTGLLVVTALSAGPPAGPAAGAAATGGRTQFLLASSSNTGSPAATGATQPALAAAGGYTAFVSDADLAVNASVPQTTAESSALVDRVYVHGRVTGGTTLLSDGGAGAATAPDISADGRLVAYRSAGHLGSGDQIDVVNRRATGQGAFDTKGNLVRTQVTGNTGDPHDQRILPCPATGGVASTHCGPQLSADGSTLAYPARLSPVSPGLAVFSDDDGTDGGGDLQGNVIDFLPSYYMTDGGAEYGYFLQTLTFVNETDAPMTFVGPPALAEPFRIASIHCAGSSAAVKTFGTLAPQQTCTVVVELDAGFACPDYAAPSVLTDDLITDATTPAGQSSRELVATCSGYYEGGTETPDYPYDPYGGGTPPPPPPPPQDCPAVPTGLPLVAAPHAETDNQGTPLVDFGPVELGRPVLEWTTVTGVGAVDLASPDCAVQLVDPDTVHPADPLPGDQPPPCTQGEELGASDTEYAPDPTSCTAYVLVRPTDLVTRSAALMVGPNWYTGSTTASYLSVTGVRNVVVVRHGPNFAARGTVASVDALGAVLPGAGQPSLSATGRYLAFSAPVPIGRAGAQTGDTTQVWRHDVDRTGDRRFLAGATDLESCLPGAGCAPPVSADAPALSGDGTRIVFATASTPSAPGQVYVRKSLVGSTFLVSSAGGRGVTPGDLPSADPAISLDGTTVAFDSPARNLLTRPTTGEATNLYVVDLGPGTTGISAVSPTGASLADGTEAGAPSLDATGRVLALLSDAPFTPAAPSDVDSAYTFERFGLLQVSPRGVGFGRLIAGLPSQTRSVSVTAGGPGPSTITGVTVTGPFRLLTNTCVGLVLHTGQGCALVVLFTPTVKGRAVGVLTVSTADDGDLVERFPVALTADVVVPTAPLLTLSPTVAAGGQVVHASGVAFPVGALVVLSWNQGLGTVTVVPDASGNFGVDLVIFPDDLLGPRDLVATGPAGTVLAAASFLVDANPQEPPFHR